MRCAAARSPSVFAVTQASAPGGTLSCCGLGPAVSGPPRRGRGDAAGYNGEAAERVGRGSLSFTSVFLGLVGGGAFETKDETAGGSVRIPLTYDEAFSTAASKCATVRHSRGSSSALPAARRRGQSMAFGQAKGLLARTVKGQGL